MGLQVGRRFVKRDPIKVALVGTPPALSGPIFLYGRIGSGKTTAMLSLAQHFHDNPGRNYKIWDLYGGKRNEQGFWALPSRHKKYADVMKKRLKLDKPWAKQYRVNFLYPYTVDLRDKLPYLEPDQEGNGVFSKVFTIPFRSIKVEDIKLVIGTISMSDETLWSEIIYKSKKTDGPIELEELFEQLRGKNTSLWLNAIEPLLSMHLLSPQTYDSNIDFIAEARDREAISILYMDHIPQKFKLFFIGYFLRMMDDLLNLAKVDKKNIFMIREAGDFFSTTNASVIEERFKIFKSYLTNWVRYGRNGIHMFLDTQSPAETQGLIEGQDDLTVLGKIPGQADREKATEQLRKDGKITSDQVKELASLDKGNYYFIENGKNARKRYLFLPRTMYWSEIYSNFYIVWDRLRGTWKSTETITSFIENDILDRIRKQKENKKLKEIIKEQEKERREQLAEEERKKSLIESNKLALLAQREARQQVRQEARKFVPEPSQSSEKVNKVEETGDSGDLLGDFFGDE